MFKFESLDVWNKSIELADKITDMADTKIPRNHQFSLGEQIRRAVLSIPTNIAEGSGRSTLKDANYFYNIAKASSYEVISLMIIMKRRKYCNKEQFESIYLKTEEIAKMLSGLMKKKNWSK